MKQWKHDITSNIWNYLEVHPMTSIDLLGAVIVVHQETRHENVDGTQVEYKKGHYVCVKHAVGLERITACENLDVARGLVEMACA